MWDAWMLTFWKNMEMRKISINKQIWFILLENQFDPLRLTDYYGLVAEQNKLKNTFGTKQKEMLTLQNNKVYLILIWLVSILNLTPD